MDYAEKRKKLLTWRLRQQLIGSMIKLVFVLCLVVIAGSGIADDARGTGRNH